MGVSTGNHGRGLAVAAKQAGVRAIVCMSELVPQNKVEGIRAQGARSTHCRPQPGRCPAREVDKLVADGNGHGFRPFDDPDVIAGQGTLGLEIVEEMPDLEQIVVPFVGRRPARRGVALAVKAISPSARVVGVTMERGAAMHLSVAAGRPVEVEEPGDHSRCAGRRASAWTIVTPCRCLQELMDDSVLVSEQQIADAVCHAYREERQIVEGSGAVGIAAIKAGLVPAVANTVVVLSGGNIDMQLHHRIISGDYETGS